MKLLMISILATIQCSGVHSESESFTLEVGVHSFQNPLHRAYGEGLFGDCCESSGSYDPPDCKNFCDNYFIVCLREYGDELTEELSNTCEAAITGVVFNNDNLIFTPGTPFPVATNETIGPLDQVPNPIVLSSQSGWIGQIQLAFRANEFDAGIKDQEVDTLYLDFDFGDLSPAVGFTDPATYTSHRGFFTVSLSFRLSLSCTEGFTGLDCTTCDCGTDCNGNFVCTDGEVVCNENYYGSDCAIFCEGRDDNTGHYNCSANGSRICLDGYQNPNTNCVDCVPAPGCSPTGGFCESPGDCTCQDGYERINCELLSKSTLSIWVIIGPVIGGVAVILIALILVLVAIFAIWKKQRKAKFPVPTRVNNAVYEIPAVSSQQNHDSSGMELQHRKGAPSTAQQILTEEHTHDYEVIVTAKLNHTNGNGLTGRKQQNKYSTSSTADYEQVLSEGHIYDNEKLVTARLNPAYGIPSPM